MIQLVTIANGFNKNMKGNSYEEEAEFEKDKIGRDRQLFLALF